MAAVSSIGSGIFADPTRTLDQSEIAAALASSSARESSPNGSRTASPSPSPSASPSSEAPSAEPVASMPQAFDSPGGSVIARCTGPDAEVVTWTPAQGYQVEGENQQGHDVEVEFESDERTVKVRVSCVDGRPAAEIDGDDDDDD
jgi:hypothetical protein